MKFGLISFGVALVALASLFSSEASVIELTPSNFKDQLKNHNVALVKFFAECKQSI